MTDDGTAIRQLEQFGGLLLDLAEWNTRQERALKRSHYA